MATIDRIVINFGEKLDVLEKRVDALLAIEPPFADGEELTLSSQVLFKDADYTVQDVQIPWSDAVGAVNGLFADLQDDATSLTKDDLPRFALLESVVNKLEVYADNVCRSRLGQSTPEPSTPM